MFLLKLYKKTGGSIIVLFVLVFSAFFVLSGKTSSASPNQPQNPASNNSFSTRINLNIKLSPDLNSTQPKKKVLSVEVEIVGSRTFSANLNYDTVSSSFKKEVSFESIPAGTYKIRVRAANSLWKAIGPVYITPGLLTNLPQAALIFGDLDQDNELNIFDYNMLLSCIQENRCPNKQNFDLNLDGKVDEADFDILYQGFSEKRSGE